MSNEFFSLTSKIKKVSENSPVLIFKDAACVVTMQCYESDNLDPSSLLWLGIKKDVDVVIKNGRVFSIEKNSSEQFLQDKNAEIIDARKLTIMPGLIDAHTHPIYMGSRANETVLKSQGLNYEEIAAKGGGISVSTQLTRNATDAELESCFVKNATLALSRGVVLLEAKSGYGLNPAQELRLLKIICDTAYKAKNSGALLPLLAPTLLGPHAESPDYKGLDSYIQALVECLSQYAEAAKKAVSFGACLPLAADIFIERGYFSREHGEKWLGAALQHGLDVHIHADEFSRSGGCELGIALAKKAEQSGIRRNKPGRVLSVDHCQYATEQDLSRLAHLGVATVILPSTSFFSNIPFVEAKKIRATGIRAAIASDFNPGSSPLNNIWFSAYLALTRCGFSMPEVYRGITCNAAYALAAEENFGTLKIGKLAHLIAFEGTMPEDLFQSPMGDHLQLVVTYGK